MRVILKKIIQLVAVIGIGMGFMASSHAAPIHPLNEQIPGVELNTGGVTNSTRSWRFTVNNPGVWVTELGVITPNGANNNDRTLSLWDYSSQTILAQTSVTAGSGWTWSSIAPVSLTQGSDYVIAYSSLIADYYFNSFTPPSSWFATGTIEYAGEMLYCNNCNANVFPAIPLANYMYGIADIGYEFRNQIPEPAALGLMGLGLIGLVLYRRKRA